MFTGFSQLIVASRAFSERHNVSVKPASSPACARLETSPRTSRRGADNWASLHTSTTVLFVADWHALTSDYANLRIAPTRRHGGGLDCGGLDRSAARSHPSIVPEHASSFSWFDPTPIPWAERVPTKGADAELARRILDAGVSGYPLRQTADVIIYMPLRAGRGRPVAHPTQQRIVRRFHNSYGPRSWSPIRC